MRVLSIESHNYRTLENLQIRFYGGYCTISGRNNAGKSSIIRLLSALFRPESRYPWQSEDNVFSYKDDITQWVKEKPAITVQFILAVSRAEDPALISFVEKIASEVIKETSIELTVSYVAAESDELTVRVRIDGKEVTSVRLRTNRTDVSPYAGIS